MLEKTVMNHEALPARVDALEERAETFERQFLQFRAEVKDEFSATRSEFRSGITELRNELRDEMSAMRDELRGEMIVMRDELRGEMRTMCDGLRGEMIEQGAALRGELGGLRSEVQELRKGQEGLATLSQVKLLHEELVERIKWISEGRSGGTTVPPGRRRPRKR